MKRLVLAAMVASLLVVALSAVAFAAPPTPQAGAGTGMSFGPGAGIHTPGTGMANGTVAPMYGRQGAGVAGSVGRPAWAGQPDAVQELLGMTDEQIQAEHLAGKSLAQIAAAENVDKDELISAILSAKKGILDAQMTAGKLTQAQADAIYANMQQQVSAMVDRTSVGPAQSQANGQTMGRGMGGRWNR